ncbi:GNAT family N-acetyltransferase [Massilia litorea]|jgi:hypothetical protein|uniref:GNAT family N-acetyltransferase n=1 Tax=Massilia litorea TaxID=2769491 RepID=A0A7L9UB32_9BURK|nr:GNAT family N-acetyltransferase [Massilia litorea]QOL52271.1 GNAT family N-acetyltransferase [Massilia litorea]
MDAVIKSPSVTGNEAVQNESAALSRKASYSAFCETEPSIPVFCTSWWLDAVVGPTNWDVALAILNGRIIGAMPFVTCKRFGMKVIQQPPLTPFLGPWIAQNGEKASTRLGNEQRVMLSLIEQLPRFDHFRQTLSRNVSNWLPFYWKGFSQTTEYTYVVHGLDDLDKVWSNFDSSRRKHCKQGAGRLRVCEDLPVDAFLALHKITLANRGIVQSFDDDCLRRLDAACAARGRRKIHIVVDEEGNHCAGTYTVWDSTCAYALMKGSHPEMHNSGAPSLCQWEAIKFSSTVAPKYDFLGNSNPSIEPYVRSFGTEQSQIFTISKTPSRLLRLRQGLKLALPKS